uniref:6-phosphogluconate dehydrogenase NADP-binding domain-containing protein n=1 Tax=Rhizochromulina marina TaxID=1034831 RepID=A0A7S2RIN4_9STRA
MARPAAGPERLFSTSGGAHQHLDLPEAPTRGRVGFLGLGIMGEGMAQNLMKSGRSILVWNRSSEKCAALQDAAGTAFVEIAEHPADVVKQCDVVFSMLSTPQACDAVYRTSSTGILAGLDGRDTPCAIVDCATLTEADMKALAKEVEDRGSKFLEAPVSGSKGPAFTGTLIFLAAGDETVFEDADIKTDLDAMGKASFFLGTVGAGTRMKLVVNMVMGSMLSALSEGLDLAEAADLPQDKLIEVLSLGAMANPMFALKGPKMIAGDHAPNFPLKHATKDMKFALSLAKDLGMKEGRDVDSVLPVAAAATARFEKAMQKGLGDEDFSAVFEGK